MPDALTSMTAKDIAATAISALALLVSALSFRRTTRVESQNAEVRYEQKRQEVLQVMIENQIANERFARKLTEVGTSVTDPTVHRQLSQFHEQLGSAERELLKLHDQLTRLPRSSSPKALADLEGILGTVKQQHARSNDLYRQLSEVAKPILRAAEHGAGSAGRNSG